MLELLNNAWGLLGTSSDSVGVSRVTGRHGELNEPLRRALLRARLREDDVAARLGVDPKTVRRWLNGRVPYGNNRAALADLVGAGEAELWPDAGGPLTARTRPEELGAVYPHRWSVPHEVWTRFFESATHEIGILAYSALFLAEDAGIVGILAQKGRAGVTVRIALGDPDNLAHRSSSAARTKASAMPCQPRSATRSRCTVQRSRQRTSRSVCTKAFCTTRSIALMANSSLTSMPMASPRLMPLCSVSASPRAATWSPLTLPASRGSGLQPSQSVLIRIKLGSSPADVTVRSGRG